MGEIRLDVRDRLNVAESTISDIPLNEPYRPFKSNEINQRSADEWIISKPDDQRRAARAIVDNVRHIGQTEFEDKLKLTIDDLNQKLGDRKYVALAAESKSNQWTLELSWENLDRKPDYVGNAGSINFVNDKLDGVMRYLRQHSDLKTVVIIDDAIYSGQQIHTIIDKLSSSGFGDLEFIVVAPFMTNSAEDRLSGAAKKVVLCEHDKILTVAEALPDVDLQRKIPEIREFRYIEEEDQGDLATRTLTYFDHKVPDNLSTLGLRKLPFIPNTVEPYKPSFVNEYIDWLIKIGVATRINENVGEDEEFWRIDASAYQIGDETWLQRHIGSMKQIEIRRKDDVIRLKSGEYFRMQEGDVIVQPRGKKWDNNEYSEEVVLFGENGFEINR